MSKKYFIYERRVNPDRRRQPRHYLDGRGDRRQRPGLPTVFAAAGRRQGWLPAELAYDN